MRRVGDRRAHVRLEVVGALWGTLESRKCAQVVDINDSGALLLCPVELSRNAVHSVDVTQEGHPLTTDIRVRHVRPASSGTFHIGVEFLSPLGLSS